MGDANRCTECGLCRTVCPVFLILKNETLSPRGKVKIIKNDILDEIFFACTLCKNCAIACPLNLKLGPDFLKHRAKLERNNKTTKANKQMIENVRKYGNPFGKIEKGKSPTKLFCC